MKTKKAVSKKKRILVVDDNDELAQTYKRLLEGQGYEVLTFPDGSDALKHVLHQSVDAIICDLEMPQLEGDTFYTTIERVEPRLAQRFIFVTGMRDDPHFQPFFDRVRCPVLDKPVESQELLQALEDLLAYET